MKTRIYIALFAVILIVAGIVNTPNALEIARSQLAIIYLFGKTLVGHVTEPGCYGLIGFLILAFAIGKRQRVRETVKQNIEVVRAKVTSVLKKNPQHRPPINDDEAVSMKLENPKISYRQIYDRLYPPKQDPKEEQKREEYFNKNWRSRVSQKVNEKIKANTRKHEM
ncbi:MAG: hypothetical protein AB1607_13180 [Chloroflexota bacterium]